MTTAVKEWVTNAQPEAPARIVARVHEVLDLDAKWKRLPVAEALIEAGDALLKLVLRDGQGPARDKALDLLAADACITWAFEAASDAPATIGPRADAVRARLAQAVA